MFSRLRNKLILINLGITSAVILVTFTMIYLISTRSADSRPPMIHVENVSNFDSEMERIVISSIREEKETAARELLTTLVVSGITIELAVILISYFLAEQAIKPVRNAYESQKIFIANASHEIKTPLAAISANLEAADIKGNKWISNVEKETTKLTNLNSELLTLARTDLVTKREATLEDVSKIVEDTIKSFNPRMQNLNFSEKITKNGKAKINREDFAQILSILFDNAIKYADKKVQVCLEDNRFTIKNDGAKISEQDLPHIFERFYQTDKTAEGVGLGLSIAKSLADRNGWKLTAKSDKMTEFVLAF